MINIFGLRLLLFDQSGYIDGNVVNKVFFGDILWNHDKSKESKAGTSSHILNKVVSDKYDQLVSGEDFSQPGIASHWGLNLFVDLKESLDFILELFTLFGFLSFS